MCTVYCKCALFVSKINSLSWTGQDLVPPANISRTHKQLKCYVSPIGLDWNKHCEVITSSFVSVDRHLGGSGTHVPTITHNHQLRSLFDCLPVNLICSTNRSAYLNKHNYSMLVSLFSAQILSDLSRASCGWAVDEMLHRVTNLGIDFKIKSPFSMSFSFCLSFLRGPYCKSQRREHHRKDILSSHRFDPKQVVQKFHCSFVSLGGGVASWRKISLQSWGYLKE